MYRLFLSLVLLILPPGFNGLLAQTDAGQSDVRVGELYTQAKAAQAQGDIPAAIAKYEEILRIAPRLAPAYNNLGALYFRQHDYKSAARVLEQGLKVNPAMSSASALLGISLYQMAEYGQARPHLEAALRANSADANAAMFLVKDLTKLGDYEAAAMHLRQLAAREPRNQEAWYLLAKTYLKLSENALAKMNAIDPNSVLAHQLSAEVMESMNNYDGAIVELKKAVAIAPKRPGVHYNLGDAYWSLSDWDSAAEQFRAELALDPGNCMARWKLADTVIQKNGNPDEALEGINKALSTCPTLTEARVDRARVLMKLNRNADAVADLEAAAKANPAEASTHFLLAKAYRSIGRAREAQVEMQTFSKLEQAARAATAERAQEVIHNKETAH